MITIDPAWRTAVETPALPRGRVHLWAFDLDVAQPSLGSFYDLLSVEERERAESIRRGSRRDRFVVGRGALRSILGGYIGRDPAALEFRYNRWGKPELEDAGGLRFNLSHSAALALCAIARRPVGVDVERVRERSNYEGIAERFFTEPERAALATAAAADVPALFFRIWTRTEAGQKARGESVLGARRRRRVCGWKAWDLSPADGYVGTVIADGSDWTPSCFRWTPPPADGASRDGS